MNLNMSITNPTVTAKAMPLRKVSSNAMLPDP